MDFLILMKQELLVAIIIFILLFLKLGNRQWNNDQLYRFINILLFINLIAGFFGIGNGTLFGTMFHTNELITFEKNLLNLGTLIISLQSYYWLKKHPHLSEFYMLLLSTLLGMFFMISSSNLLMFYLSLELSTIPLTALSNFNLEKRISSEAAFKFIMSSAFSSGLLLFGISLIYGTTGSLGFSEIGQHFIGSPLQILGLILLIAGFGFKISIVPFHLWVADVYEGSPVSVTSYLSVISKGAFIFIFISALYSMFQFITGLWYNMMVLLAILSMIIGNLFALRQQNMKRFLAFSSIAQMGFILVGISGQSIEGNTAAIFFIMIYVFSNLGAFGVISIVSELSGREEVDDYKGFYKNNPILSWVLTLSLFSLAGIPPTAGFFGKFFLLMAAAGQGNYALIIIAALNMVISLYYYLRIVKAIFMDENAAPIERINSGFSANLSFAICIGGILITGLASGAYQYIYSLL